MLTLFLALVIVALLVERALEVALHRRNAARLRARGAVWLGADGFGLILGAQVILFAGSAIEAAITPWGGATRWTVPLALVLVLAQALRYWCIATLGERWSMRVVTVPGEARISRGPYRFFSHPNYLAVMIEAIALPLACGAYATLVVVAPLQLLALWRRVRHEERALRTNTSPRARVDA